MKRLTSTLIALFVLSLVLLPSVSLAEGDTFGLDTTARSAGLSQKYGQPVTELIGNIIGTALSLVSVVFFALMIFFGFKWMLDRGKGEDAKQALDGIIAAIIGIIIVLASYAITSFVFNSLGSSGGAGGGGGGNSGDDPGKNHTVELGGACEWDSDCKLLTGVCNANKVCADPADGGVACNTLSDCTEKNKVCADNLCVGIPLECVNVEPTVFNEFVDCLNNDTLTTCKTDICKIIPTL